MNQRQAMSGERCRHGMIKDYCAICKGGAVTTIDLGVRATKQQTIPPRESRRGNVVLWGREQDISSLPEDVYGVHMVPQPSLRKLRFLVRQCPNIKSLILPPSHERIIKQCHLDFLQAHGVEIEYGYWSYREALTMPPSVEYKEKQAFYKNLTPGALAKLSKLRTFGFEEVTFLERYLCVNGGRKINLQKLAKEVGMSDRHLTVSLNALLLYLGASPKLVGNYLNVAARAREFDRTVKRLDQKLKDMAFRSEIERYKPLPANLPPSSWDRFRRLTEMEYESPERFQVLRDERPKQYWSLIYNFGLNGSYKTLEQIGEELGFTRERARQLRNKALENLGIFAEELERD